LLITKKNLGLLADIIRNQDPNTGSRVELMSGGEVSGTVFITCLKVVEDQIEVASKVVEAVWPWACAGQSQTHPEWAASYENKLDLITEIQRWMRKYHTRCE
jgi:hypothetical protein